MQLVTNTAQIIANSESNTILGRGTNRYTDSLAHDHQRCLALPLLLVHLSHHLQHGVNWRMSILMPGEKVEQCHLMDWSIALGRKVARSVSIISEDQFPLLKTKFSSTHPVPVSNLQNSHLPVWFGSSLSKRYNKMAILIRMSRFSWPELGAHDLGHERQHILPIMRILHNIVACSLLER